MELGMKAGLSPCLVSQYSLSKRPGWLVAACFLDISSPTNFLRLLAGWLLEYFCKKKRDKWSKMLAVP